MDASSTHQRELEVLYGALQVSSRLSRQILSQPAKGVVQKEDFSPVTIADFAIQALLACTVKAAFPGDTVVGEENASQLRNDLYLLEHVYELLRWVAGDGHTEEASQRKAMLPPGVTVPDSRERMCDLIDECGEESPSERGRCWVFDPIDGTKTYVKGELYAVNAALLVDGKQQLGMVACPNLSAGASAPLSNASTAKEGCVVYAIKGEGAYVRSLEGSPADILDAKRLPDHSESLSLADVKFVTCITGVDSALANVNETLATRLGVDYPNCDLLPWVLRWTTLALGLGNTTVWVYKKKERRGKAWDHAGAMLLFEETGGKVTDVHGKDIDLSVGRTMDSNFGFVAAPSGLHSKVLAEVHTVLKDMGHEEFLG